MRARVINAGFLQEVFCAVRFRIIEESVFRRVSIILPSSIKITRFATLRAKPFRGSPPSSSFLRSPVRPSRQHFVDHLRIQRRRWFVEQHGIGSMHNARAIATRCCWPPESAPETYWHVRKARRAPAISMLFTSRRFIAFKHFHLRQGQVSIIDRWGNSSKC